MTTRFSFLLFLAFQNTRMAILGRSVEGSWTVNGPESYERCQMYQETMDLDSFDPEVPISLFHIYG